METYEIIKDESALEEFVAWLPDLNLNEKFYVSLQVRKKYMPHLKSRDNIQLKRFVVSKDMLVTKIRQLECPVGAYRTKEGEVVPNGAMALYITPNPRDMKRATYVGIKALVDLLHKGEQAKNISFNPYTEMLSCIHKTKSKSTFVHFDIDKPTGTAKDVNAPKSDLTTEGLWELVTKVVGVEATTIVETRGGWHLMIEPTKVVSETKNWHQKITKQIDCDQTGDLMMPVVGCCQGDFVPRFYKHNVGNL